MCAKPEYGYRFKKETFDNASKNGEVLWGETEKSIPKIKKRLDTATEKLKSYYYEDNRQTTSNLKKLFDNKKIFDNPKSVSLIKYLAKFILNKDDIILDFFAGSGTTAQAVLELNQEDRGNRKFICVQLPEKTETESEANKAGYVTIAEITRERIKRVINKIQTEQNGKLKLEENNQDLGFKSFKLVSSNFKQWRSDLIENEEDINQMVINFEIPQKPLANETLMFWELLIKSGYELTTKTEVLKINNLTVYKIENNYFILSSIDEQDIDEILKLKPSRIIALDSVFHKQDSLKTNIAEQCRQTEDNRVKTVFTSI